MMIVLRMALPVEGDGGRHNEENDENDNNNDNEDHDSVPGSVPGSVVPGSIPVSVSVLVEEEKERDGWGGLDGRPQCALDSRENFLLGNPSWFLYFWEMADMYQLLDSTMQRLSLKVGLADGDQGTTVYNNKKRKFDTTGSSVAASDMDSTYFAAQEKTMGRINVFLDQMAESSNTDLGMRNESIRLGLESIDERRKDRNQEKELALQRQVLEKELETRGRQT